MRPSVRNVPLIPTDAYAVPALGIFKREAGHKIMNKWKMDPAD